MKGKMGKDWSAARSGNVGCPVSGTVFFPFYWGQVSARKFDQAYAQLREEGHNLAKPTEEFMAKIWFRCVSR